MKKFYVVFGLGHFHRISGKSFDRDCVAVVEASSEKRAYQIINDAFGKNWFSFDEEKPNMSHYPRGFITL